ncbi:MAG: LD-carboxypeptidase [Lachnospiraceae bacterium]|nr:LD-carboxypeptidase [Lachnospiraceae bacterium]
MLKIGDKVGIVCCSNPQRRESEPQIKELERILRDMGLNPVFGNHIYEKCDMHGICGSAAPQERAGVLMNFYRDDAIKAIFDISGGDIANGVLPHLDYNVIASKSKLFWGYSDLTTLVNAVYAMTGKPSVLYQVRNMISAENGKHQITDFRDAVMESERRQEVSRGLFQIDYKFLQGKEMQGIVVGGNIRCFLKLAGTPYMPDLSGKILLLEARSGLAMQIETYFAQLAQMGAFEKVSGVLLGTFSQLEKVCGISAIQILIQKYVSKDVPIAVTRNIGHGTDAKAIMIGRELS